MTDIKKSSGEIVVETLQHINMNNDKNLRLVYQCIEAINDIQGISLITKPLGKDIGDITRNLEQINDICKKWLI